MSDTPLRIELVVGSARVGGTERQVLGLAAGLVEAGHEVTVVLMQGEGPLLEDFLALDLSVVSIGYGGISPSRIPFVPTIDSMTGFSRLVGSRHRSGNPPQVSHAFLDGCVAMAPYLGRSSWPRPRRVAGIRGFRDGIPAVRKLFARNVLRADAVVCNAPHLVDEMVDEFGVDPCRTRWIPNGVALPECLADTAIEPPTAIVVANFHPYKGHDTLLDAVHRLACAPQVRLCGTGDYRDHAAARIAELGLDRIVTMVPPPADIATELARAQFAIHPSHTEGTSNAVLEELASGLPVIACAVGGNTTLVEHGVNGLLVPPGDPGALAGAIERMSADPTMRRRMSSAARVRAEQFSWPACVAAHVEIYRQLAERGALLQ